MIDAYDKLFEKYPREAFIEDCLGQIIFINIEKIAKNWEEQKLKLINKQPFYIRGYGRDAKGTGLYFSLYKYLFEISIIKDSTNNAKPTELISKLTNYSKIIKIDKNETERIQNYQVSHLFGKTKNPLLFTAAWNIAYIPKYLDPFTGHEIQGEHKKVFQEIFITKIKKLFDFYIKDYNLLVENQITPFLEIALAETRKEHKKINSQDFNKFVKDAKAELSKIE